VWPSGLLSVWTPREAIDRQGCMTMEANRRKDGGAEHPLKHLWPNQARNQRKKEMA
jgi:hypothetical protein